MQKSLWMEGFVSWSGSYGRTMEMCHCCLVEKRKRKEEWEKTGTGGRGLSTFLANSLVAEGRYPDAPLFVPALFILLCYLYHNWALRTEPHHCRSRRFWDSWIMKKNCNNNDYITIMNIFSDHSTCLPLANYTDSDYRKLLFTEEIPCVFE